MKTIGRNRRRLLRLTAYSLFGAAFCAGIASCMVGPDYERPKMTFPTTYKSATTEPATRPALASDWWRLFGDPTLNDLEESALRANTGLQAAMARVAQARALSRVSASDFFPVITLDPSLQRSRTPPGTVSSVGGVTTPTNGASSSRGGSSGGTHTNVRIPFDLGYEVDLWGRVRRSFQASEAQARASVDDLEVVLQTLEADVASDYFSLRSLDLQEQILVKTVESFRQQLELTRKQQEAGLLGRTDFYQADAQLNATTTQLVEVCRQRADEEHAISTLLGRTPAELGLAIRPLDLEPPEIPPGLPAELLRRRPDVAEAEQNLIAASAQVGVATAAFYPTLQLTGAAGFESMDVQHALDWEQRIWSIGPSITFPIFEGGRLEAGLEQARGRFQELHAVYRGSVLAAVRDVEDSLTDLHMRSDEAKAQGQAVESSRQYLRLSDLQYHQGLVSYLQVIDAERTLLNNELSAAQILNQRLVSTVLLIKSMGGGWDAEAVEHAPAQ